MDREVVKELIQDKLSEKLLRAELGKLLEDGQYRASMLDNFEVLIQQLGGGGASEKAAQLIVNDLTE
jgi:lipid-A-disaccharide synthase